MFLIQKKKLYENRYDDLTKKKLIFQKYQFSIEENATNVGVVNALKDLNSFTKTNKMY